MFFIDFRERGSERDRNIDMKEKYLSVVSYMRPGWGSKLQSVYVPWPESNLWHLGAWKDTLITEQHRPTLFFIVLIQEVRLNLMWFMLDQCMLDFLPCHAHTVLTLLQYSLALGEKLISRSLEMLHGVGIAWNLRAALRCFCIPLTLKRMTIVNQQSLCFNAGDNPSETNPGRKLTTVQIKSYSHINAFQFLSLQEKQFPDFMG